MNMGLPVVAAIVLTIAVMVALAFAIEGLILRHLVNQPHIVLFMATIGLAFVFEGLGEMIWGANVKKLDVGLPSDTFFAGGMMLNEFEISAAVSAAILVALLVIFLQKTAMGRALRPSDASRPMAAMSARDALPA